MLLSVWTFRYSRITLEFVSRAKLLTIWQCRLYHLNFSVQRLYNSLRGSTQLEAREMAQCLNEMLGAQPEDLCEKPGISGGSYYSSAGEAGTEGFWNSLVSSDLAELVRLRLSERPCLKN